MQVLVLLANPAEPALDDAIAARVLAATGGDLDWLAPRLACEIASPKSSDPEALARQALSGLPVDVALVPGEHRRKRLLVADMDSTMINQESIDELAAAAGVGDRVAAITARAMAGELDFEASLETRVALLKGLTRRTVEDVRRERITLAPGGRALVHTMKAYGARTALVSGGFTLFACYFARRIGFDEALANTLEFDGDCLAGTVQKPIVGRDAKRRRLVALTAELGLQPADTLAVGDGANDLDMLGAAGLGVALRARPAVAEQAAVRIDHADLTALLYLQGYRDAEIVR
ncbi:MAG TPA: phosphoserine phosphatase SerB [Devosiaceae bacterium]|nr:phosphoserine phosphatase SerB [Devosiaceae bacterium]